VLAVPVGESVVLYDPPVRKTHVLNTTAAAFLAECDGTASLDDIAVRLGQRFGVGADEVRRGLLALLPALDDAGLFGDVPPHTRDRSRYEELPPPSGLDRRHRRLVDEREWVWRSEPLGALGFEFEVCTDDRELATYLEPVLASLRRDAPPTHRYVVRARAGASAGSTPDPARRLDLTLDGRAVQRQGTPPTLATQLLWHINRMSVAASADRVVLHAAGAAAGGRTVLLPATPESGKSTLVAGLVRRGFSYLSDESVALVPGTTTVEPYPKAISLDRGSWEVLAALRPTRPGVEPYEPATWHVPPADVGRPPTGDAADVDVIVFPTYDPGAATTLTPVEPVDALVLLLANAFDFDALGQAGLDALTRLATTVPAYCLVSSDLDEAVDVVTTTLTAKASR
jgi:hypothetical protein